MTPERRSGSGASDPPLRRRDRFGPLAGLAPLLASELRPWIRTRLGWSQAVLWSAVLVGGMAIPLVVMRDLAAGEMGGPLQSATELFLTLSALLPAIGAVILTHGVVLGERQAGTAAWILSKPVGRASFLVAKAAAWSFGLLITAHLIPTVLGWGVLSIEAGEPIPVVRFAAAAAMSACVTVWTIGLMLLAGTGLASRGAVLASGLAVLIAGDLAIAIWPTLAEVGPWMLGRMAVVLASGGPLVSPWPIVATVLGAAAFLLAAVALFGRQEV